MIRWPLVLMVFLSTPLLRAGEIDTLLSYSAQSQWAKTSVNFHLRRIHRELAQRQRILRLTSGVERSLNLDRALCSRNQRGTGNCPRLFGVYLPFSDEIYLSDHRPLIQLHELIHAYQYKVRFPLDVTVLYDKYLHGQISRAQFLPYLNYYYESQAFWYTISTGQDREWNRYRKRLSNGSQLVEGGLLVGAFVINPVLAMGLALATKDDEGYLLIGERVQRATRSTHGHYPRVDEPIIEGFREKLSAQTGLAVLGLHELPIQKPDAELHSITGKFLHQIAVKIEQAYFGDLDFINSEASSDQGIYVALHNNYYNAIAQSNPAMLKRCEKLYRYLESGKSPLHQWLEVSQSTLASCPLYSGVNPEAMAFFGEIIRDSVDSPFWMGGGSEGSTPGLMIQPHLDVLSTKARAESDSSPWRVNE